jgi:hypothetical protein
MQGENNLETQFQPVTDPSVPAVIETIDVALRSYFISPAREPQLTTPDEFHEGIRGLKVGKAPVSNGIPNSVLKHLPKRAVPFSPVCWSPHPSFSPNVVARSNDLCP